MKIGLLCGGRFASRRLLPHFKNHSEAELAIIHNRSLSKAEALARQFEVPQATNLEQEVLDTASLDGVIICSPNFLHKNLVLKALDKGLAVWIEKPPALNAEEVREILEIHPSPSLMVGQCYRFKSALQVAKQKIEAGLIGSLKSIDLHMHMNIPQTGWRATKRYGGGVLLELGIHLVDALSYLSHQNIAEVYALGNFIKDDENNPLIWELKSLGKTEHNIVFNLSISFCTSYSTGFRVIGTQGELTGEFVFRAEHDDKEKLIFKNRKEEEKNIPLTPQNIFNEEITHFCKLCKGQPTPLNLHQGYQNMRVIDALDLSLSEGKSISLNELVNA